MQLNEVFKQAMQDYALFLEKGYPQKIVLKLVGDRYKLSRTGRNILYRGISKEDESAVRKAKLISSSALKNEILHIDALNQLYTVSAYLNGNPVFLSTDGILRDAAAVHGTGWLNIHLNRTIELVDGFLNNTGVVEIIYYIDEKVNHSRELASTLEHVIDQSMPSKVLITPLVDQELRSLKTGIIATSDSQIIDKSEVWVLDLARIVLNENFSPEFTDLGFLYPKF